MVAFPVIIRLIMTVTTFFTLLGPTLPDVEPGGDHPVTSEAEPSEPDERGERRRPSRRERRAADVAVETSDEPTPAPTRPGTTRTPPADEPGRDPDHLLGELDVDSPLDLAPSRRGSGDTSAGELVAVPGAAAANDPPGADTALNETMKGAPGCKLQCIMTGRVYARGIDAELVVTTDTPAEITLYIYGATHGTQASKPGDLTTSYAALFEGLNENSEYYVIASARDSQGNISHAHGTFRTLRRVAEVTFHLNWEVTNPPSFTDQYHYHYRVDGTWRPALAVGWWPYASPPAALPSPVAVEDAPEELDVGVQVVVASKPFGTDGYCPDNAQPFGPHGGAPGLPSPFGSGDVGWQGDCYQLAWASAIPSCVNGVVLDDRPADATSWVHHQLSVTLNTGGCYSQPIGFTVPLTIDVSYVP